MQYFAWVDQKTQSMPIAELDNANSSSIHSLAASLSLIYSFQRVGRNKKNFNHIKRFWRNRGHTCTKKETKAHPMSFFIPICSQTSIFVCFSRFGCNYFFSYPGPSRQEISGWIRTFSRNRSAFRSLFRRFFYF